MCQLMEIQLVVHLVARRVPPIDKVEEKKSPTDRVKVTLKELFHMLKHAKRVQGTHMLHKGHNGHTSF